jgi:beta-ribofuranosylaminobenzene 5'-phosphate synthase
MITVQAHSRLHFGLFSLATESHWPNGEGQSVIPARKFGGVGLMVESPGVRIRVEQADSWSAEGPMAQRILGMVDPLIYHHVGRTETPNKITVEQWPAAHVGLGTGTQLALALARSLRPADRDFDATVCTAQVASLLGRGERSALGIYGFLDGGFMIEGGKRIGSSQIAPLLVRHEFPRGWRIVLTIPLSIEGLHGGAERDAFKQLVSRPNHLAATNSLCRLALLGMLPALVEQDCRAFGESLYDFNRRVGEMFAPVQGGPYSHPRVAELVEFIRKQDVPGVGQSSWGPTVFAVVADEERASHLAATLRQRFALTADEVICTAACNHGATVTGEQER